jgi:uncharacterized protein (TIGR02452 family)
MSDNKQILSSNLVKIADQTCSVFENGKYICNNKIINIDFQIEGALNGSRYYPEMNFVIPKVNVRLTPNIIVTEETTSEAAQRLCLLGQDVAILNFASGTRPGGGWLEGARAQEEDLCRCSMLGCCLEFEKEFYEVNKNLNSRLYTSGVVYIPNVPFIRNKDLEFVEPYLVSTITCPAPNVNKLQPGEEQLLHTVLYFRAKRILEVAAMHGHKNIILGAWGCGIFGNEPIIVAKAFKASLYSVPAFENVCFAIFDSKKDQPILKVFKEIFT